MLFPQSFQGPAMFTRHVSEYLTDDAYRLLQTELTSNPEFGDMMPGTGGFRKLRWGDVRRGKGRRGGLKGKFCHKDKGCTPSCDTGCGTAAAAGAAAGCCH